MANDDGLPDALGFVGRVDVRGPSQEIGGGLVLSEKALGVLAVLDANARVDHERGIGQDERFGHHERGRRQCEGYGVAGGVQAGFERDIVELVAELLMRGKR